MNDNRNCNDYKVDNYDYNNDYDSIYNKFIISSCNGYKDNNHDDYSNDYDNLYHCQ